MPPKKKARLKFDPNSVFYVTASTSKKQVPRNVRIARVDGSVRFLPHDLFESCHFLEEVIFEEGVQTIGKRVFRNCSALANVKLPSTLLEIRGYAFCLCKALCSIDLPEGLQIIGESAFRNTNLRHVEAPVTAERIEDGAFAHCAQLESVVLPPRLDKIAWGLFMHCEQLREVQIPSTTEVFTIGSRAFFHCSNLQSLDLSHCIECVAIHSEAFKSCGRLSFIELPPNLEYIEGGAFFSCSMLTHVRMPPTLTSIGYRRRGGINPFAYCEKLVSLEVSEGLESIDLVDFDDERRVGIASCLSLVNLYVPPSQKLEDYSDDSVPFTEDFQLANVATGWGDLVATLQHRFDGLPLHKVSYHPVEATIEKLRNFLKLNPRTVNQVDAFGMTLHKVCYFHSYHPVEVTIEKIHNILKLNPSAVNQADAFGMTPLHILSLAQKPVVELLHELPSFSKMALSSADRFASTPLDYLCKNPLGEGLHATQWIIRKFLEGRLLYIGLDEWKQELLGAEEQVRSIGADTLTMSDGVGSLFDKLARLEFLEVLSLVEMVLWRIKLDENMMVEADDEKPRTDRESCRVQCGISIVIGNVLPFLGKEVVIVQTNVS